MSIPPDKYYYHSRFYEYFPFLRSFSFTYISLTKSFDYVLALITNVNWSIKCFIVNSRGTQSNPYVSRLLSRSVFNQFDPKVNREARNLRHTVFDKNSKFRIEYQSLSIVI